MEWTLSLIKPDGVSRGLIGDVIKRIEASGLKIVAVKMMRLTKEARGSSTPRTASGRSSMASPPS